MTTPRVTEIPPPTGAVEPDPFVSRARQRLLERQAEARRLSRVRELLRAVRNAVPRDGTVRP